LESLPQEPKKYSVACAGAAARRTRVVVKIVVNNFIQGATTDVAVLLCGVAGK
jgi:hypothetical protein